MREDLRFEIDRAYDLLPHVVGASWASVWFRLNGVKKPGRDEFRAKAAEFFSMLEGLADSYSSDEQFADIKSYMKSRHDVEVEKILSGKNSEIEKRYERYVDYG
jgi:hypothetical protein